MNPLEQLAAKFATAYVPKYEQGSTGYVFTDDQLRRFRAQVIEEEHKRLMEVFGSPAHHIMSDGECIGYYSTDQLQAAVLRERERIAEFVEEQDVQHPKHIAAAIRSGA